MRLTMHTLRAFHLINCEFDSPALGFDFLLLALTLPLLALTFFVYQIDIFYNLMSRFRIRKIKINCIIKNHERLYSARPIKP